MAAGADEDSGGAGTAEPVQGWWSIPADDVVRVLGTVSDRGLSADRVEEMRARYGPNALEALGPSSEWRLLWESIRSPMMVLLLSIAVVSVLLGQFREAVVMVFVVAMYVGIELLNKARADRTMAHLRELQAPRATVLREGRRQEIPFEEVVVGDILPIEAGTRIAADARLLSSAGLLVNEGSLTGEAAPQAKDARACTPRDAPLAERPTAIYAGTTVLDGQGTAVVVAVGKATEFGRVAALTARATAAPTPLQQEMRDLARTLAVIAVVVSALIPLLGWIRGYDARQMLLTWLSLTFLMVPGQPPVIITMALALASFELARRQVIVRRLQGAETLGSVETILSDKTGTMTENTMALTGIILGNGQVITPDDNGSQEAATWQRFFAIALPAIPENSADPTDRAVRDAAGGKETSFLADVGRLVHQVGFAQGKDHRVLEFERTGERHCYVTGSPEFIIAHSTRRRCDGEWCDWEKTARDEVLSVVARLAGEGKRITAYAYQPGKESSLEGLCFAGCAVLNDPVRPGVRESVMQLAAAGIRTVMVTGDNPGTARFVARTVGLDAEQALTGADIDRLTREQLSEALTRTQVFARATPEHKLRLVETLKSKGQVVAVTGDGVNDAPALRTADIGVAMGTKGTDVAKESAGLILTDDNFAHLPAAVAIGRKAYDNFRKGITYYLSAKAILLVVFLIPLLLGLPFPLTPIQIIVVELLMDLASSTIFISEPAEPGAMQRGPRRQARFLSWEVGRLILRNMAGLTAAILAVYLLSLAMGYGLASARTAAFATWLLGHILLALNLKQEHVPLLQQGILANRFGAGWLAGMVLLVLSMTLLVAIHPLLNTTFLAPAQWLLVVVGAFAGSAWIEVRKLLTRGRPTQGPRRLERRLRPRSAMLLVLMVDAL